MITKEQKLKTIRSFNKTKLNLLNLHLDQKINELESTVRDISHIRNEIHNIQRKCDL